MTCILISKHHICYCYHKIYELLTHFLPLLLNNILEQYYLNCVKYVRAMLSYILLVLHMILKIVYSSTEQEYRIKSSRRNLLCWIESTEFSWYFMWQLYADWHKYLSNYHFPFSEIISCLVSLVTIYIRIASKYNCILYVYTSP